MMTIKFYVAIVYTRINGEDRKDELKEYTEGMNRLVEQMYFYDNFNDEYKITKENKKETTESFDIIDTSLNIHVVDANEDNITDVNKDNQEIISKMELKIKELEKTIDEMKKKDKVDSSHHEKKKKTKKKKKTNNGRSSSFSDESSYNKEEEEGEEESNKKHSMLNKLKKDIEEMKKNMKREEENRRIQKRGIKKKMKEMKGDIKKEENDKIDDNVKSVQEDEKNKTKEKIENDEELDNEYAYKFNIDDIINTEQLNNIKNGILHNVYYYIYESYDQRDYDILENLAKKHEIKGRKISYNINLPKYNFNAKELQALGF
ncbi:hypothetical protein PFDG_02243 [Plasmodium falciparum Dd2]|uniref:Uncharacterized protein n=1 Tax=Plasmodium falciparum (isolate Dd2) TaxID=57267 RepID=A0A0L7M1Y2_PLAF4|nr:hypothetical protein PFDG_02243 [Plasmodium falciparum Dd2]